MHIAPHPDELAIVRLAPGQDAVVATADGDVLVRGEDPTGDCATTLYAFVPHTPTAVGWDARTRSVEHVSTARRVVRGHKLDEPVWAEARALLKQPPHAVYVRIDAVAHYARTRLAAVAVRAATGSCTPTP